MVIEKINEICHGLDMEKLQEIKPHAVIALICENTSCRS